MESALSSYHHLDMESLMKSSRTARSEYEWKMGSRPHPRPGLGWRTKLMWQGFQHASNKQCRIQS